MEFKGTKGKWEVQGHPLCYWEVVSETDLICVTAGEEAEYNAQLISCAPEMLEMLIKVINEHKTDRQSWSTILEIEQLIKKATEI